MFPYLFCYLLEDTLLKMLLRYALDRQLFHLLIIIFSYFPVILSVVSVEDCLDSDFNRNNYTVKHDVGS